MRCFALILLLALPSTALAEDTTDMFSTEKVLVGLRGSGKWKVVYQIHVAAVTETLQTANAFTQITDKAPLFCTPPNMKINGNELATMVSAEMGNERTRGNHETFATASFAVSALMTLDKFFPCN